MPAKYSVDDLLGKFSGLKVKDPDSLQSKLDLMVEGGSSRLQVISDFDYTISKFKDENGQQCWTTHGVFDHEANRLSAELGRTLSELREKYVTIEFDAKMSVEEKVPHMLTWWDTAHKHIAKAGFSRSTLESYVRNSRVLLRDNCSKMLLLLEEAGVPLILFSAGIGDLIQMFFQQQLGKVPKNIHLISNMMIFDSKGEREFFHHLHGRSNVLLLGDSLGDLHMDVGVENETDIIKIGFLNRFDDERFVEKFVDGYDIVLQQDPTMNVPLDIIETVLSCQ